MEPAKGDPGTQGLGPRKPDKIHVQGEDEKLQEEVLGKISLEHDILQQVAGTGKVFAFLTDRFWMSINSAGSAIYANRVMLGKVF